MNRDSIFAALGLDDTNPGAFAGEWLDTAGTELGVEDPTTGEQIGAVTRAGKDDYERVVASSVDTFAAWRMLPAPERGEYVRQLGNLLREFKEPLGALVSLEMGKIKAEGEGEVQEMIDICDFAVGLSRQLYGLTIASERPRHRMYEQWHPLGPIGVISSFNFPVAVWAWNATLAAVCGDTADLEAVVEDPADVHRHHTARRPGHGGVRLRGRVQPGRGLRRRDRRHADQRPTSPADLGHRLVQYGPKVGTAVAQRLGRSLLELGGNNAVIVMDDADPELATRAALFAAVGTAGQRCTSLRRLIVQRGISDLIAKRLVDAYGQVSGSATPSKKGC